jgi:hypothetical protein
VQLQAFAVHSSAAKPNLTPPQQAQRTRAYNQHCADKHATTTGRNLSAKKGSAGASCKDFSDQTFTCVQFIGGQAVLGAANGKLYLFEGTAAVRSISAHCSDVSKSGASPTVGAAVGGAVYAMHCVRSSGGGKGGDRLITG